MHAPRNCIQEIGIAVGGLHLAWRRVRVDGAPNAKEATISTGWTSRRRAEFHTGRACARQLLASLGAAPVAIGVDSEGAPQWPDGFVGSISHKRGFCLVGVARRSSFAAVGVDLERDSEEASLLREIASEAEISVPLPSASILLSAKEAIYKAQYGITGRVLSWRDLTVAFGSGTTFSAHVGGVAVAGRYLVEDGWIASIATINCL